MRVREIAYYIDQIDFKECILTLRNGDIGNINNYKKAVAILENIPIFKNDIKAILEDDLYSTAQDNLVYSNMASGQTIYRKSMTLLDKASLLLQLSNELYPPLSENTISIKLPNIKDMKLLYQAIKSFEQSFSFLVTDEAINSTIVIENWEHGSFWLNLYAGSFLAVSVISSAAWSAAVVANKYQEVKIHEQYAKTLELKNEEMLAFTQAQKKLIDVLVNNETRAIIDKHMNASEDQERFERVKRSIEMLAELIRQGAEVNPALSAPEDVKNLFPDYSKLEQITSKIPQIEHKKNEE
ncbi:MAG: hypothetical protein Q8R58_02255 [Sulfuricurvum sp.]|nr:hypothetical protein [Sulfuricurvum sp.]